jgi:hypothetical protein
MIHIHIHTYTHTHRGIANGGVTLEQWGVNFAFALAEDLFAVQVHAIHTYTYTHIHTYTYTHIHIYSYTHIHTHTHRGSAATCSSCCPCTPSTPNCATSTACSTE